MSESTVKDTMLAMGRKARAAAGQMARSSGAARNTALRKLAVLLRAQRSELQAANRRDLVRAEAGGLAPAMLDRLKLTPRILETVALGCEQLANLIHTNDSLWFVI